MVGKSVDADFSIGATSSGAIGIFSEILTLDLGSKCRFRFRCFRWLSIYRIDVVGAR